MFSLRPRDAVEVRLAAGMDNDPVMIPVVKVDDKPFVALYKGNHPLQLILKKKATKSWFRQLSFTNIFEQLKQLKDGAYAEALSNGPSKRSRSHKSWLLRLPQTCTIEAPSVSDISGITIRVLLSCLAFNECRRFGLFAVFCSA